MCNPYYEIIFWEVAALVETSLEILKENTAEVNWFFQQTIHCIISNLFERHNQKETFNLTNLVAAEIEAGTAAGMVADMAVDMAADMAGDLKNSRLTSIFKAT